MGFELWLSPSTAGEEEGIEQGLLGLLLHEEKSGDLAPVWQTSSFCQRTPRGEKRKGEKKFKGR